MFLTLVGGGCAGHVRRPVAAPDPDDQKVALLDRDPLLLAAVSGATAAPMSVSGGHGGTNPTPVYAFRTWTFAAGQADDAAFADAIRRAATAGARLDDVTCGGRTFIAAGFKAVGPYVGRLTVSVSREGGPAPVLRVSLSVKGGDDTPRLPFPSATHHVDAGCPRGVRAAAGSHA
ncbi:MAG TPA: hypothetical protein VFQ85_12895 [Mycobacteriales bacterium]|nr:hypothetical protein [Mycobacteriales bacterium]